MNLFDPADETPVGELGLVLKVLKVLEGVWR